MLQINFFVLFLHPWRWLVPHLRFILRLVETIGKWHACFLASSVLRILASASSAMALPDTRHAKISLVLVISCKISSGIEIS